MKQVIICRTDLRNKIGEKVRTGKLAGQVAHASLKALLDLGKFQSSTDNVMTLLLNPDIRDWINGNYKKIVLGVSSEEELLAIYQVAVDTLPGVPKALIQDSGLTEFSEPTYTTVAIGPGNPESIDKITGYLKLL